MERKKIVYWRPFALWVSIGIGLGTLIMASTVFAEISSQTIRNASAALFTQVFPSDTPELIVHTVRRGETLSALARRYHTDVQTLKAANRLKSSRLAIGQKLIIPTASLPYVAANRPPSSSHHPHRHASLVQQAEGLHFIWPVRGKITSHYGRRQHPMGGHRGDFHSGIDIGVRRRTPVLAAEDGVVVDARYYGGYGRTVILSHKNGFKTLYAHNHRLLVRKGQWVKQGEVIALSGNTGRSSGPHLHFEILKNGKPLNPLRFLD
ncbi:MAG: M23 family metallopeptidase [Nitrospinota bacterium]|nr:MAG: M23 family metallopeptidase [Nitrospinota bacterium]